MSHEQSDTITRPSGAYNVYGGTQYPLNPEFSFEKPRYDNVDQAVNAAQWRSRMGGGPEGGQSPAYGFSNTYQPSEQAQALGQVLQALQDPRNQWMGTGMVGGIRGLGNLRNFFHDRQGALNGGSVPAHVPQHYSQTEHGLSASPQSYAESLAQRHDSYNKYIQDGINEGMSPSQAEAAVKSLNLAPPGLKQTEELRFFRRSPANDN